MSHQRSQSTTVNINLGADGALLGRQHHDIFSQGGREARVDRVTEMVAWVAAGVRGRQLNTLHSKSPSLFLKSFLNNSSVNQGQGLIKFLD
jgi:hypothetical protein